MYKLLRKPVLVRKYLIHLFWDWFLTLSFFLSYIGNWPFKYVVAKLQVKMERNFCLKRFYVIKKESSPWMFS